MNAGQPLGVALDGTGNVYVADSAAGQVDVFSPAGVPQTPFGPGLALPAGVALDGAGNVYVVDDGTDWVDIYNRPGLPPAAWLSGNENGTSRFVEPSGIAVNAAGTTLYVADTGNEWIDVYTNPGSSVNQWQFAFQLGLTGFLGNGAFSSPVGVALGASGNVYVADDDTGLVQVFNSQGNYLAQWDATLGTNLLSANYVAVGNCLVYVTDGFGEVGVFDLNGNVMGSFQNGGAGFASTEGVALGGNGNAYVADAGNGVLDFFGPCASAVCPGADPTPTITSTPPSTNTPSPTPTLTWTITVPPMMTATSTVTNTPSSTLTATPTLTNTPSPTPSVTWTVTVSPTATVTESWTPTSSRTGTDTPTLTKTTTPTFTRTLTRTWTPTHTLTKTPTPTSTRTRTFTVTFTPTRSKTATPTLTKTPTRTSTPTVTRTPTRGKEINSLVEGNQGSSPTWTGAENPAPAALPSVVAAPNLSFGEPVQFRVTLVQGAQVTIQLYSLVGERVWQGDLQAGAGLNTLSWDLRNQSGETVASGLYLYVVSIDDGTRLVRRTGKVAVIH
jgi:hypothetical protein